MKEFFSPSPRAVFLFDVKLLFSYILTPPGTLSIKIERKAKKISNFYIHSAKPNHHFIDRVVLHFEIRLTKQWAVHFSPLFSDKKAPELPELFNIII